MLSHEIIYILIFNVLMCTELNEITFYIIHCFLVWLLIHNYTMYNRETCPSDVNFLTFSFGSNVIKWIVITKFISFFIVLVFKPSRCKIIRIGENGFPFALQSEWQTSISIFLLLRCDLDHYYKQFVCTVTLVFRNNTWRKMSFELWNNISLEYPQAAVPTTSHSLNTFKFNTLAWFIS